MTQPVNPYAPPQTIQAPPKSGWAPFRAVRPYYSVRGKTEVLSGLTLVVIFFQVVLIFFFAATAAMFVRAREFDSVELVATLEATASRQQFLGGFAVVASVASLIMLFIWVYAVHANLLSLGAKHLRFTPGWAVGWFFFPIANLVQPYFVMAEIWKHSDPAPLVGRPALGVGLVGWWWGLFISSGIAGQLFNFAAGASESIDALIVVCVVAIALTAFLEIPMNVVQLILVRRIQKMQDERYEIVANQGQEAAYRNNPLATLNS